jgi:DNA-binding beta-propeller fold protein YncE
MKQAIIASTILFIALCMTGCQSPPRPIFPAISPDIVWPPPPDRPRIKYIGELTGEASLRARPRGMEVLRQALAGPKPKAVFVRPTAVAICGERVFVADTGEALVHMLDLKERRYRAIQGNPSDPLRIPIDLAIVDGTTLVVADRSRGVLDTFDIEGNWQATRRFPEISAPVAVAWDSFSRRMWVADAAAHACLAIAGMDKVSAKIGQRGSAPGEFNFPTAIAVQPNVALVVADAMNFRVQVFDAHDKPATIFGQKGDAAGDFARPRDVALDSEGHIYVLDNQFENVQIFDRAGQLLMAFGHDGSGPGEFSLPSGITIDTQDRIWIADSLNRRVQVFQYLAEGQS